jgi:CRISPR/Cas system CSM-associated protein Csm3 (group 7 of RAMP superfamily)
MSKQNKKQQVKKDFKEQLNELAEKQFGIKLENNTQKKVYEEQFSFLFDQLKDIGLDRVSRAPYNFIPLNETAIECPDPPVLNIYHSDRFTGYILLDIITHSAIYIKDLLDEIEIAAKKENKDISNFFSPGGKIRIPGSTLRGLIRNLIEIISFGKFGFFDNKRLYFRGFADKALGGEYKSYGLSEFENNKVKYSVKCGILKKNGLGFDILDCGEAEQIPKIDAKSKIESLNEDYKIFHYYNINKESYYIVVSGDMMNKTHDWKIKYPLPKSKRIALLNLDIADYNKDDKRSDKIYNLFEEAKKGNDVPCFYIQWKDKEDNQRITVGHTGMMRLSYKYTIGEHIPDKIWNNKMMDFANAIFGDEKQFAGRVFFEDAFLNGGQNNIFSSDSPLICKPLLSPNPTSFQHYLVQDTDELRKLRHYNLSSDRKIAAIRGNKFYWHKKEEWQKDDQDHLHKKEYEPLINPLRSGVSFNGKVRFENLSAEELGALLSALQLPPGCFHKIGMAKPYGLGSIEIKTTLNISKRKDRYSNLTCEFSDKVPKSNDENENIIHFKNKFAKFILNRLNKNENNDTVDDLWRKDRLMELRRIMSMPNNINEESLKYMELNEFTKRKVLPLPSKVK